MITNIKENNGDEWWGRKDGGNYTEGEIYSYLIKKIYFTVWLCIKYKKTTTWTVMNFQFCIIIFLRKWRRVLQ